MCIWTFCVKFRDESIQRSRAKRPIGVYRTPVTAVTTKQVNLPTVSIPTLPPPQLNGEDELSPQRLMAIDGNNSAKRVRTAGTHDLREFRSDYFLTRDEVDQFKHEVRRVRLAAQVSYSICCFSISDCYCALYRRTTQMPPGYRIPATPEIQLMALRVLLRVRIDGKAAQLNMRSGRWISTTQQDSSRVLAIMVLS